MKKKQKWLLKRGFKRFGAVENTVLKKANFKIIKIKSLTKKKNWLNNIVSTKNRKAQNCQILIVAKKKSCL